MQRSLLIPVLAALSRALPTTAPAAPVVAGPPTLHDRAEEDLVDEDFCGTGRKRLVSTQLS